MKKIFKQLAITAIVFSFAVSAKAANLVSNGDFEAGNTGFTTDYIYNSPNLAVLSGMYTIYNTALSATSPSKIHDHTSGTGNLMYVNGSWETNKVVWSQTINVETNTNYDFSIWSMRLGDINFGDPYLDFRINNVSLGNLLLTDEHEYEWTNFSSTWNSRSSTQAVLSVYDLTTDICSNDFALDDIGFNATSPTPTPEPSTMLLGLLGTGSLIGLRKRNS